MCLFEALQLHCKAGSKAAPLLVQVLVPVDGVAQLYAGLFGLVQSAQRENPRIRGQLIAVDAHSDAPDATLLQILQTEAAQQADIRIRYRQGQRQVHRWQEWHPDTHQQSKTVLSVWRADGVYLITGGAGGLGLIVAQDMLEGAAASHVILCGRTEWDSLGASRQQPVLALQSRFPGRVTYDAADLGARSAVEALIDRLLAHHGRLTGIVHSVGVIADALLLHKTPEQFRSVLAPKVGGVTWLDEVTRDIRLDCMVLFSSMAGSLGNVGQADYAAANAYLDAFASWRSQQVAAGARHGVSIALGWPLWAEGGMGMDDASRALLKTMTGMEPMPTPAGLQVLHDALAHADASPAGHAMCEGAYLLAMHGQTTKIQHLLGITFTAQKRQLALAASHQDDVPVRDAVTASSDLSELSRRVQQQLADAVARQLKLRAQDIDADSELSEYGFDSISLTEFANALNTRYNLQLMPTTFFEHPTLASLSGYLVREHGAQLARYLAIDAEAEAVPPVMGPRLLASTTTTLPRGAYSKQAVRLNKKNMDSAIAVREDDHKTNDKALFGSQISASLAPIRIDDPKQPIFWLPGVGGNVTSLRNLALALDNGHPFYALPPRESDGVTAPHERVEDMAADHIRSVRQYQPEGPYLLAGHSFGSWIAFEMTRQLKAQGHDVQTVMILDLFAPSATNQILAKGKTDWLTPLIQMLEAKAQQPLNLTATALASLDDEERLVQIHAALVRAEQLSPQTTPQTIRSLVNVVRANMEALFRYVAQPQGDIPVVLFRASDLMQGQDDSLLPSDLGWSALAGRDVSVITVPGNHFTMLSHPHVMTLASAICTHLDALKVASQHSYFRSEHFDATVVSATEQSSP